MCAFTVSGALVSCIFLVTGKVVDAAVPAGGCGTALAGWVSEVTELVA